MVKSQFTMQTETHNPVQFTQTLYRTMVRFCPENRKRFGENSGVPMQNFCITQSLWVHRLLGFKCVRKNKRTLSWYSCCAT